MIYPSTDAASELIVAPLRPGRFRRFGDAECTDIIAKAGRRGAPDPQENFIDVPLLIGTFPALTHSTCKDQTKLLTPPSDSFVRHIYATFGQDLLNITIAQRESVVEPNG